LAGNKEILDRKGMDSGLKVDTLHDDVDYDSDGDDRSSYPEDAEEDYGDSDDESNMQQGILKRSSVRTSQKSVRIRKTDGTGLSAHVRSWFPEEVTPPPPMNIINSDRKINLNASSIDIPQNNDKLLYSLNQGTEESQTRKSMDFGESKRWKSVDMDVKSEKIKMKSSERLLLGIEKLLMYNQDRNSILLERQNKINEENNHKNKMKKFPLLVKNLIILNNVTKSIEGIKNEINDKDYISSEIDDQPNLPVTPTSDPVDQTNEDSHTSIPSWESYINRRTPLCSSEQATVERKSAILTKTTLENRNFLDINNCGNNNENNDDIHAINDNNHDDDINKCDDSDKNKTRKQKNPIRHIIYLRNLKMKEITENSLSIYDTRGGLERGKPLLFLNAVNEVCICMYV
jgi:hypothetical protein